MPYDEGTRSWKIRLYDRECQSRGLLVLARHVRDADGEEWMERFAVRTWRGRPRPAHFETLYLWDTKDDCRYFVLIHSDHEFRDDDYAKEVLDSEAAEWLIAEQYALPDDLKCYAPGRDGMGGVDSRAAPPPLTPALREVWALLEKQALTAKELAPRVDGAPVSEDSIRKRVAALRRSGRAIGTEAALGYYRPDASPPEWTPLVRESG